MVRRRSEGKGSEEMEVEAGVGGTCVGHVVRLEGAHARLEQLLHQLDRAGARSLAQQAARAASADREDLLRRQLVKRLPAAHLPYEERRCAAAPASSCPHAGDAWATSTSKLPPRWTETMPLRQRSSSPSQMSTSHSAAQHGIA